ncbi:hypothetical protein CAPTEDRAFT_89766 [Capitella teleta]|uniref:BTB domain-containing protein n=1 Tax=Capitella teleta TaxID=283909 RepID=R7T5L3_CAPTE|nr:hypothetical protein CAPTEDRAFT_89766 [Capitella teleta]|eukprot:ELT88346.1 hypothetical protein CAPTEDRAFT_89766 [Capitella teleta]
MWLEQKFCDTVLILDDGQMYAHKVVFAAHSQALAKDFQNFPPGKLLYIKLKDFDPSVVFDLTEYLYTGKLKLTEKNTAGLYKCALELGITSLLQTVKQQFASYDVNNVFDHLLMCDQAGLHELRDDIMRYISQHFNEIVNTKGFLNLTLSYLLMLLSSDDLCVMSELEVFYAVVKWVDFQRQDRMTHAEALLKCVRFRLLDPDILATKVETVDWLFRQRRCHEQLVEAYK